MLAPDPPIPSHLSPHPRRFHGWAMLGVASAALIASSPGQTVIVSQFNTSFREDLGLSAATLGGAYMVGTLLASLPLVFVGSLSDRFGPRLVTGVIAVLFALACASVGFVNGLASLTVAFFLLRFLGQGSLGLLSGHILALWFERKLGTANGLKLMAAQVGFAILPWVALELITSVGWRLAYPILGAGVALMLLPLLIFVARNHPESIGQQLDGDPLIDEPGHEHDDESPEFDPTGHKHIDPAFTLKRALRTPAFWILTLTGSLNGLIGTALIFHAQPMLESRALDPALSASILRTWSFVMMLAIFPAGWIADRVPIRVLGPLSLVLLALSAGAQLLDGGLWVMHASMALFGLSQAVAAGAVPPAIARFFGRAHHGAIRACASLLGVAGTGLGPVLLGLSIDELGSFKPGLVAFIAACAVIALPGVTLRRPTAS